MRGGCPGCTHVNDWWVDSVAGSDSNSGMSPISPKKTLASVNGLFSDGGTLHLKRGSRFKETFDVHGKRLNLVDYGEGNKPLIDGSLTLNNANFSATAAYANVYQITVSYLALDGVVIDSMEYNHCAIQFFCGPPAPYSPGVDNRLKLVNGVFNAVFSWINYVRTHAENLAYVRDNPGTFYAATTGEAPVTLPLSGGADQFVLYVHLPGSVNPITSGEEYSIGSNKHWVWYQRFGGTINNIWWARWSFQNHGYFERCEMNDCEWSQAARHGPFHNDCVVKRCKSFGSYLSGAAMHGYRGTSSDGSSSGNVYIDCDVGNGNWGYFSHGSGGPTPNSAIRMQVIGGTITNVQTPVTWDTSSISTVTGVTCNDVTSAIGSGNMVHWHNCEFRIKRSAAENPPSGNLIAVFSDTAGAELFDCTIDGGDATMIDGGDVRTRYLCNNVGASMVITRCVVTTAATVQISSQPVTVIDSVWPGV